MSLNKNAAYRYRLIDLYLRQRKRSIEELQRLISNKLFEEFDIESGISQRQLLEDIKIMRKSPPEGYGAPILRKQGILSYTDKNFTIHAFPLVDKDLDALKEAMTILKQLADYPHYQELKKIFDKLSGNMSLSTFKEKDTSIQFETSPLVKGKEFIHPLHDFIKNKNVVNVLYNPYHEDALHLILHPYLLKEYNNRWFLIAWSEKYDKIISIAMDRIEHIEKDLTDFIPAPKDFAAQYTHIVGITIPSGKAIDTVRIKVSKQRLPYILTKPLHASQRLVAQEQNGTGILELSLIPNFEFKAILMGHGAAIEVLSPEDLRKELSIEIKATYEQYFYS